MIFVTDSFVAVVVKLLHYSDGSYMNAREFSFSSVFGEILIYYL